MSLSLATGRSVLLAALLVSPLAAEATAVVDDPTTMIRGAPVDLDVGVASWGPG